MRTMDELRPLSAGRLLELWRACREIEDPLERVLQCNGEILAECCHFQGEPVYAGSSEALSDLTGREMEELLRRLAEGQPPRGGEPEENPVFDLARFAALRGE
ncbi:MAG: hypothetical protein HFG02_07895 [Oscillibacter sp.]|nr:hypothetical protein [Oscillibacter sp.]